MGMTTGSVQVLTTVNSTTTETTTKRTASREINKILTECRDLAVTRLSASFGQILDRVSDMLMERASNSDVRDEQQLFLDARGVLKGDRAELMSEFERQLRKLINDRISGKTEPKADFSKVDATQLTLVDTSSMDESVLAGNIARVVENLCHDELAVLNRGMGHLLGYPDMDALANPLGPVTIVSAFSEAVQSLKAERRVKFQIMKDLNQAPLAEIAKIYSDVNAHLTRLNMVPAPGRSSAIQRRGPADRSTAKVAPAPEIAPHAAEVDVMAMFKRMYGSATPTSAAAPSSLPPGMAALLGGLPPGGPAGYADDSGFPAISMPGGAASAQVFAPMRATPSGYVPGAPIISSADLHEGLTRLQAGQTAFAVGGASIDFSGIPQGLHNVLRDLQDSPLAAKANQLESMTIEMVAMLFDFIFETKDLPDGIKALLARLQIPVLKASMLDSAFFAKKSHPARVLVNDLAHAGLGWATVMGQEDPLYRTIDGIVHQILDNFSDDLTIFDEQRDVLEAFLLAEERDAEANILSGAEQIDQQDRQKIAGVLAKAEIEKRVESYPVPNFVATFLRQKWQLVLEQVYLLEGEEGDGWSAAVNTIEDLVWSVQPKKAPEDRRHLVALLPSLLKRLSSGMQGQEWAPHERESFMSNLVEAHAAAVKPALSAVMSPTDAVAEAAKMQAVMAKAAGDEALAAKAEALVVAMTQAEPEPVEAGSEAIDDDYMVIARSLERGMWIEFESDDGQLVFAKLAWVSPLRGTYLFTNRQGQKALSMTAEDLAERFRADRARLVEAEPLIDRAFSSMLTQIEDRFPDALEDA